MLFSLLKNWLMRRFKSDPQVNGKGPRRRGATAMEYLVVISFILVVLIIAVQSLGGVTKGLLSNSASATSKTTGS